MSKRQKTGKCVYCGAEDLIHYDHIPPKNLFIKPRPQLITIPSCKKCNSGASKDDEYFRLVLAPSERMESLPVTPGLLEKIERSMLRQESQGFKTAFLGSLRTIFTQVTDQQILQPKIGYEVNFERVNRVASRIIKGLIYFETGRPLSSDFDVRAYAGDSLIDPTGERREYFFKLLPYMKKRGVKKIGNDIFFYGNYFFGTPPEASAWVLIFYKKFIFYGLTVPKAEIHLELLRQKFSI